MVEQSTIAEIVQILGGVNEATEAAEISRAWFYKCLDRGAFPPRAAFLLLRACNKIEPGAWPVSRLAELTLSPSTIGGGDQ